MTEISFADFTTKEWVERADVLSRYWETQLHRQFLLEPTTRTLINHTIALLTELKICKEKEVK